MKKYLGDGVYIERDAYGLVLTTEQGAEPTNTIYLDHDVWTNLMDLTKDMEPLHRRAGSKEKMK